MGPFDKGLVVGQSPLGVVSKKQVQGGHSGFLSPLSYSCKVRHTIICHMLYSYSEGSQLELSLCMNKGARFSSSQFFIFLGISLTF